MKTARTTARRRPRCDVGETLRIIADWCAGLPPGALVPTHTDLMRRFKASERAVLKALDELQRRGVVVRKNGVGTFIADAPAAPAVTVADRSTVVAIARPDSSFFDHCMERLCRHAQEAGLTLVCRMVGDDALSLTPPTDHVRPQGFIVFRYTLEPLARRLQEAGCRVVLVGAPPADAQPAVPCIHGDHEQGAWLATGHCIARGHRRIAFLGDDDLEATLRWQGHRRALAEARRAGMAVTDTVIRCREVAAWLDEPARAIAALRRPDAPTAIAAWNDHEALLLMAALRRADLRIPEDVSVVGYDDLPQGRLAYPPLTTIDHGVDRQLQAAIAMLMRSSPPAAGRTTLVMPRLVERGSVAAYSDCT